MPDETPPRSGQAADSGGFQWGSPREQSPLQGRAEFFPNGSWELVVSLNRGACARGCAQHGVHSESGEAAGAGWESGRGVERSLAELLHADPAAFDNAFERAERNRFAAVRRDDDLMPVGVPPFLMAAFLRDQGEAMAAKNARDFGCGADRVVAAHVSATSKTFAPAGRSRSTGSNQSARASRALAMASSSVSPALAQPGISGKTADQRSVSGSCSTTRRTFIVDM